MSEILSIKDQEPETLKKFESDLSFELPPSKYVKTTKYLQVFDVDKDDLYVPKAYLYDIMKTGDESYDIPLLKRKSTYSFHGEVRDNQKEVRDEALKRLKDVGTCIISAYPGFGKTFTAINLAYKLGQKTLIICNRLVLIEQWEQSIRKFCTAKYQVVKPTTPLDKNVDFYIMNAINVCKKKREDYEHIKFVIVDECHLILADKIGKCMLHLSPHYLLGLSATSYRISDFDDNVKAITLIKKALTTEKNPLLIEKLKNDLDYATYSNYLLILDNTKESEKSVIESKMKIHHTQYVREVLKDVEKQLEYRFTYETKNDDIVLNLFFGEYRIKRELVREHHIYKIESGFKPVVETTNNGMLKWSTIIDSLSNNEDRNEMIVRLIQKFNDRVILVLTKRVSQAEYLLNRLLEENENATSLFGENQVFDKKARILIGTTGKCSVGFDHPTLNTLILACDLEQYFIQSLGRIFRTVDDGKNIPYVIDIVDDFPTLKKHFITRKLVYEKHGGIFKDI